MEHANSKIAGSKIAGSKIAGSKIAGSKIAGSKIAGSKIAGSKILVTGASSGIGAALAPMLAERGATVGIVARRRERLDEVLDRCQTHAPASRAWTVDLG